MPRAAWYFCQNIPCVKFSEAKLDGNLFFLFTNESLQNSLNVGQQQGWMLLIGQYENVKYSQCWLCCGPSFQVLAWSRIEQRELQWSCETWQCVNITCCCCWQRDTKNQFGELTWWWCGAPCWEHQLITPLHTLHHWSQSYTYFWAYIISIFTYIAYSTFNFQRKLA